MGHPVLYYLPTSSKQKPNYWSSHVLFSFLKKKYVLQMVVIDHKKDIIEWFKRHLIGEQVNCVWMITKFKLLVDMKNKLWYIRIRDGSRNSKFGFCVIVSNQQQLCWNWRKERIFNRNPIFWYLNISPPIRTTNLLLGAATSFFLK